MVFTLDWYLNWISIVFSLASFILIIMLYNKFKSKSLFVMAFTFIYAFVIRSIYAFDIHFNTKQWLVPFWPMIFISFLFIFNATNKFIKGGGMNGNGGAKEKRYALEIFLEKVAQVAKELIEVDKKIEAEELLKTAIKVAKENEK